MDTEAWKRWSEGQNIPRSLAEEIFRIDMYADDRTRGMKIARVKNLFTEDSEIQPFIEKVAEIVVKQD